MTQHGEPADHTPPQEVAGNTAGRAGAVYRVDVSFHRVHGMRKDNRLAIEARGTAAFVTRMAEAAADAFEEETRR